MSRLIPALLLSLLFTALTSQARSASDDLLTDFKKVGEARLEVLFWDVYDSILYSKDGSYTSGRYPLALRIHYLRDIDAEDLIENTAEQWDKLDIDSAQYQPWLQQLADIWPDISEDDELLLIVDADKASRFFHNGNLIGDLSDPDFGPTFLAIWLDINSSYPKLRKRLIGAAK